MGKNKMSKNAKKGLIPLFGGALGAVICQKLGLDGETAVLVTGASCGLVASGWDYLKRVVISKWVKL